MTDSTFKYAAFISYRHLEPDKKWAKDLHTLLETYETPAGLVAQGVRKRIGRVFRDEVEFPAEHNLSAAITAALEQSQFLIVVCSPRTPESEWVQAEIDCFRQLGRQDRILTLLIEGEPRDVFPRGLCEIVTPAGTQRIEPLAVDVRRSTGLSARRLRKLATLRFAAKLLNVDFEDLYRRDLEREIERARKLTAIVAAVAVVVLGLALFAGLQWRKADDLAGKNSKLADKNLELFKEAQQKQKDAEDAARKEKIARGEADRSAAEAKQRAKEAQQEYEKADQLSQFLLTALQPEDPTRFLGATFYAPKAHADKFKVIEMMETQERRARHELASRPHAQTAVLDSLGNMYRQLALFDKAEPLLNDALAWRKANSQATVPNDLARSYFHLGWLEHERGRFALAQTHYQAALEIYLDQAKQKRYTDLQQADIHQHLAWLHFSQGNEGLMDKSFDQAISCREVFRAGPVDEKVKHQILVDIAYTMMGKAAAHSGLEDFIGAKRLSEDPSLHRRLNEAGMGIKSKTLELFVAAHKDTIFENRRLTASEVGNEKLQTAAQNLREALQLMEKDTPEPVFLGAVHFALAKVLVLMNKLPEAEVEFEHAFRGMEDAQMYQIPQQAGKVTEYASLLHELKKHEAAQTLWTKYLAAQEFRFGKDHEFYKQASTAHQDFNRRHRPKP